MGGSESKYEFQEEFSIIDTYNNYYELKKANDPAVYAGKKIESSDEQQINHIQQIITQKINNPSPFLTKLLQYKKSIDQDAPCFKAWTYFYLLYDKPFHKLSHEIQRRTQQRTGFHQNQIDNFIVRVCKGIKYLYEINHQHTHLSTNAIAWPQNPKQDIQIIDQWALDDQSLHQFRQQYENNDKFTNQSSHNAKQCLDLYRTGVIALEMLYCGQPYSYNKKQVSQMINHLRNPSLKQKLQILCNPVPNERKNIYRVLNNSQQKTTTQGRSHPNLQNYTMGATNTAFVSQKQITPQYPHRQQSYYYNSQQTTPIKNFSKYPSPNLNTRISPNQQKISIVPESHMPLSTNIGTTQPNFTYRPQNNFQPQFHQFQGPSFTKQQSQQTVTISNSSLSWKPSIGLEDNARLRSQNFNNYSFGDQSKTSYPLEKDNLFTSPNFIKNLNSPSPSIYQNSPSFPYYTTAKSNEPQSSDRISDISIPRIASSPSKSQDKSGTQFQSQKQTFLEISQGQKQREKQNKQEGNSSIDSLEQVNNSGKLEKIEYINKRNDETPLRDKIKISTIPQLSESAHSNPDIDDEDKEYIIEEYENGSKYQGYKSKKTGAKTGRGRFYYKEGSYYDGQWKQNNMHGYGKLFYANSKPAYEGQWYYDRFHGKGKVYNDEPFIFHTPFDYTNFDNLDQQWQYYQGTLVSDEKEGQGKLMLSNGQYYEGEFQKDRVHGKGKFITNSGQTIKGIWNDSILVKRTN